MNADHAHRHPGRRTVLAAATASVWMMPVVKASADSPAVTASQNARPGGDGSPSSGGGSGGGLVESNLLRWYGLAPWCAASGQINGNLTVGVADPGQQALISVVLELRDEGGALVDLYPHEPAEDGGSFTNIVTSGSGIQLTFQFKNLAKGNYTVLGTLSGAVTTRRLPSSGASEQGYWVQELVYATESVQVNVW